MTEILERCEFFLDSHLWTLDPRINFEGWLKNFHQHELPYAEQLLNSFFYINDKMTKALLKAAHQKISLAALAQEEGNKKAAWQNFLNVSAYTTVDIENINPSASGYQFLRWAKLCLDIPDEKILTMQQSIEQLHANYISNIIFIDDIICSGLQFTETWTTPLSVQKGLQSSYAEICSRTGTNAYYIPLIATQYGIDEIRKTCNHIEIIPGNLIDDRYSIFGEESLIWGDMDKDKGIAFVEEASKRAGIPSTNWKGWKGLGLTIAFQRAIPDATLPIFSWKENGWIPLINLA